MEIIFAQQLVELRQIAGLSQEDLAGKLFVTRQAISKWERGEVAPDLNKIERIAEVLGVSTEILLFGKEQLAEVQVGSHVEERKNESNHRRAPRNVWEFLAWYWWILFAIGGYLTWFIPTIMKAFQ